MQFLTVAFSCASRQSRAVLVLGVPFPGAKDRCVVLKKNYNSRYTQPHSALFFFIPQADAALTRRCSTATRGTKCRSSMLSPLSCPASPAYEVAYLIVSCATRHFELPTKPSAAAFAIKLTMAGAAAACWQNHFHLSSAYLTMIFYQCSFR